MTKIHSFIFLISSIAIAQASSSSFSRLLSEHATSSQRSASNTLCEAGIGFLTTPFAKCFTFNSLTSQNSGVIEGLPSCWQPQWVLGSVVKKSYNLDHTNYLLGDTQDIGYIANANIRQTWFDANTAFNPRVDFGAKLVAITNQGDGDAVTTYHGTWEFIMIPLKSDFSFDIIPNGQNPGAVDKICFNLIGYA